MSKLTNPFVLASLGGITLVAAIILGVVIGLNVGGSSPAPTPTLAVTAMPTRTPTLTPIPTSALTPEPTLVRGPIVPPTEMPAATPTEDPLLRGTELTMGPSDQTVTLGAPFTVNVVINNAVNLGAYQFTLDFDPTVIQYYGETDGPFLGSTGRTMSCIPPSESGGSVRIQCDTSGPEPAGPNGSGVLATFRFLVPAATCYGGTTLRIGDGATLTDVMSTTPYFAITSQLLIVRWVAPTPSYCPTMTVPPPDYFPPHAP
jgi:hypothetical protein